MIMWEMETKVLIPEVNCRFSTSSGVTAFSALLRARSFIKTECPLEVKVL